MKGGFRLKKVIKTILGIFAGIFLLIILLGIYGSSLSSQSLAAKLDSNSKIHYATSITSNYDYSDKAQVYSTEMSLKETALYLINEKQPLEYSDIDNEEAIQLTYDDYYVLIYKNEDGDTYIQISSRKFIHHNGYYGLYRPYRNNIITFYSASYATSPYYRRDVKRYGSSSVRTTKTVTKPSNTTNSSSSKIQTNKNASTKIQTENSKPKVNSSASSNQSVRSGSTGTKSRSGGGTSFGK